MTKINALKLQNEDEVVIKKNTTRGFFNDIHARVIGAPRMDFGLVIIDLVTPDNNYYTVYHKEIS